MSSRPPVNSIITNTFASVKTLQAEGPCLGLRSAKALDLAISFPFPAVGPMPFACMAPTKSITVSHGHFRECAKTGSPPNVSSTSFHSGVRFAPFLENTAPPSNKNANSVLNQTATANKLCGHIYVVFPRLSMAKCQTRPNGAQRAPGARPARARRPPGASRPRGPEAPAQRAGAPRVAPQRRGAEALPNGPTCKSVQVCAGLIIYISKRTCMMCIYNIMCMCKTKPTCHERRFTQVGCGRENPPPKPACIDRSANIPFDKLKLIMGSQEKERFCACPMHL